MDDLAARLTRCFTSVFPELDAEAIQKANAESLTVWDSMAQIMLLSLIGEEFEMDVSFEEFGDLTTFEQFRTMIQSRIG